MALRRRILMMVLGLVVVLGIGLGAYLWFVGPEDVEVIRVAPRDVVEVVIASGQLRSRTQSELGVDRGGVIGQVTVEEGARVEEGELLVALRSADLQSQVAKAEAQREAARQGLEQLLEGPTDAERRAARADIARAEAAVENARDEYERAEELVRAGVETGANRDAAKARLAEARADLRAARARLDQLDPRTTQVEQARARVNEAAAALQAAQAELDKATVRAPFAGLVTRVGAEPGQSASPGESLLTLASLEDAEYLVETDEDNLDRIEVGQPAFVYFPSAPDKTFEATVRQIGPEIDPERGVVSVHLRPKELPPNAFPGLTVDVNMVVARLRDTPAVPVTSLRRQDGEASVLVVDEGRAVSRPVEVVATGREFAAVRGLDRGMLVVADATAVEPGARVDPEEVDAAPKREEASR